MEKLANLEESLDIIGNFMSSSSAKLLDPFKKSKFVTSMIAVLSDAANSGLWCGYLKLLTNILWVCGPSDDLYTDEELRDRLMFFVFSRDDQLIHLSMSAVSNLIVIWPQFSDSILTENIIQFLQSTFAEQCSPLVECCLRFYDVLSSTESKPRLLKIFPAIFRFFTHKNPKVGDRSLSIVADLVEDPNFAALAAGSGIAPCLHDALITCPPYRIGTLFRCFIPDAIDKSCNFLHDEKFYDYVFRILSQVDSIDSDGFYGYLSKRVQNEWMNFFKNGIIDVLIEIYESASFKNRLGISNCISTFIVNSDEERRNEVAEKGGFRIFCEFLQDCGDPQILLLHLSKIIRGRNDYLSLCMSANLEQILVELSDSEDECVSGIANEILDCIRDQIEQYNV